MRESFRPYRFINDEPNRRRGGTARRDQNGNLVRGEFNEFGEPLGSDPNNRPMGLSSEADWRAKFGGGGAAPVAPAAPPARESSAAVAMANPAFPAWMQAAGAGMAAAEGAGAPRAAMPAATGRSQFGDLHSVMEARVPGWASMTPEQRRAAMMGMPKATAQVGQVTGRDGYTTPRPNWMQTTPEPWQDATFKTPYGTASVASGNTYAASQIIKQLQAGDRAYLEAWRRGERPQPADPSSVAGDIGKAGGALPLAPVGVGARLMQTLRDPVNALRRRLAGVAPRRPDKVQESASSY